MNNKKILLSSIILSTGICLTGCDEKPQDIVQDLISSSSNIDLENTKLLKHKEIIIKDLNNNSEYIHDIEGYHVIKFDNKNSSYFLSSDIKKDSIYNKNTNLKTLFYDKTLIFTDSGIYLKDYDLKYNNRNDRNIFIEDNQIIFSGYSYDNIENSSRYFLSLEDEINHLLNKLINEADADEIIKFIKNQVYKNENTNNNEVSIKINDSLNLTYRYYYNENANYTNTTLTLKNNK